MQQQTCLQVSGLEPAPGRVVQRLTKVELFASELAFPSKQLNLTSRHQVITVQKHASKHRSATATRQVHNRFLCLHVLERSGRTLCHADGLAYTNPTELRVIASVSYLGFAESQRTATAQCCKIPTRTP